MSDSTRYTPGPWFVDDKQGGDVYRYILADVGFASMFVAKLTYTGMETDRTVDANARLISAAPELLEALRMVMNVMPAEPPAAGRLIGAERRHYDAIMAAKKAIKKAEGRA